MDNTISPWAPHHHSPPPMPFRVSLKEQSSCSPAHLAVKVTASVMISFSMPSLGDTVLSLWPHFLARPPFHFHLITSVIPAINVLRLALVQGMLGGEAEDGIFSLEKRQRRTVAASQGHYSSEGTDHHGSYELGL